MPRIPQEEKEKGSQKWLQILVNKHPELIKPKLVESLKLVDGEEVTWVSPLATDKFAEYSDEQFLKALEIELKKHPLQKFWPPRGPNWDGLAKTNKGKIILVEAKSHIAEINSPKSGAASKKSLNLIRKSLKETKDNLGCKTEVDWATRFYQYTNRLAHLYLLTVLNRIDAYLVVILFLNDTSHNSDSLVCPKTSSEWEAVIELLERHLGLPTNHKLSDYVKHIFIDVKVLKDHA